MMCAYGDLINYAVNLNSTIQGGNTVTVKLVCEQQWKAWPGQGRSKCSMVEMRVPKIHIVYICIHPHRKYKSMGQTLTWDPRLNC